MNATQEQTSCKQCGTCCRKGGPVLHHEDKRLLDAGFIRPEHLITIRKGEPAFSPLSGKVEPAPCELIKINGRQGEWTCCFFDTETPACSIYAHRPLECRLLECWNTEKLISVINKNALARADIIRPDDVVMDLIAIHEQHCPSTRIEELLAELSNDSNTSTLAELTEIVRKDLVVRSHASTHFKLPLQVEFFILGRPLFKQLAGLGLDLLEKDGEVHLQWNVA